MTTPTIPTQATTPPQKEPAYYQRRKKRAADLIGQILIRRKLIDPEYLRTALRIQEAKGGQIGRILVRMGACGESAIAQALQEQRALRAGTVTVSTAARENPNIVGLTVECKPWRTRAALIFVDVVSLALGAAVGQLVNRLWTGAFHPEGLLLPAAAIALCLLTFGVLQLYAAMAPAAPDELRATSTAVTLMSLCAGGVALLVHRDTRLISFVALTAWWAASLFTVPLGRAFARARWSKRPWWGHPVVVLGAGKSGRLVVKTLLEQRRCGLTPVMMLDDDRVKHGTLRARIAEDEAAASPEPVIKDGPAAAEAPVPTPVPSSADLVVESARPSEALPAVSTANLAAILAPSSGAHSGSRTPVRPRGVFAEVDGIPVVGELALAPLLAKRLKIPYAVIAMPGAGSRKLLQITERVGGLFSHILLIPDLFGFATLGVPARDVGGILGIEVRQQLLLPLPRLAKRAMDVALTVAGGLVILPLLLAIALLIKLDSRGPIFYSQERLGQDKTRFWALKFRTMHGDGEARLKAVLESDPQMRAEYLEFHKLTNDPRITRIGRFLRKYSLDELPQIWNVLTGEMSLVGPRPYLEREIPDMEHREAIILRAPPGVTGLWQVSDRNATGFAERVKMDVHYVRNWSPWLDIYILARTLGVVLRGTGV